ncbi:MAG: hypothetical protein Q4C12_02925 [Clostridia bacterium]|nr:hypothetical protein [Clostridia bacterium]
MKKRICMFVGITITLCTAVYAFTDAQTAHDRDGEIGVEIAEDATNFVEAEIETEAAEILLKEAESPTEGTANEPQRKIDLLLAGRETSKESFVTEDAFQNLAQTMRGALPEADFYKRVSKTAVFMSKYCRDSEERAYFSSLLAQGRDFKTVSQIYQFWLTTNEDIGIIEKIYDMVYYGEEIANSAADAIFEEAFNELTDNKCGALTREQIENYITQGVSVDDIRNANLLCRQGVKTIEEILDEYAATKDWNAVVSDISKEKIDAENTQLLFEAVYLARVKNTSINDAVSEMTENGISETWETWNDTCTRSALKALKQNDLWRAKITEGTETIIKSAEENGISRENVIDLLNKGVSEIEILDAVDEIAAEETSRR